MGTGTTGGAGTSGVLAAATDAVDDAVAEVAVAVDDVAALDRGGVLVGSGAAAHPATKPSAAKYERTTGGASVPAIEELFVFAIIKVLCYARSRLCDEVLHSVKVVAGDVLR